MKKSLLLFGALLFLVIGYAGVNTVLNITGVLKVSQGDFIVRITNTIMNNNDISKTAINEEGNEFQVKLNDTAIISYDIVNESLEYDALVYFSCNSNMNPETSVDWYLSDNYIKANGVSRGQASLYFSNQAYYDEIEQKNARIAELMHQYENGTNTDYDKDSIMNEVNQLNREKERLYNLIIDEDTLTCKMELKAIEKTKVDPDDNKMDDVKFISATENDKDVSSYISGDGKKIDFSSTKDTQVFFDVKNSNSTYASSVYIRCTSTSSPNSNLYYGLDNGYAKPGEKVSGDILLELNQERVNEILAAIDERIRELQYYYDLTELESDKDFIERELNALKEERERVEDSYVESDNVTCELIVEHIELIPDEKIDEVNIEFANVKKGSIDINNVISKDKKNILLTSEDNDRFSFEIINKTKTYDTLVNIDCESQNEETLIYYYLTNNYIRSRGTNEGGMLVQLNKRYILQDIESLDHEETFNLHVLDTYEISQEYHDYLTNRLIEIAKQREELYERMIDEDKISCKAEVINYK